MVDVLKSKPTSLLRWVGVPGLVLLLGSCASPGTPLVADHSPVFGAMPATYQVRPGDTLYSVAWRYGLDVVDLAGFNKIAQPFTIYPRQQLRLRRPPQTNVAVQTRTNTKPPTGKRPVRSVDPVDVKTKSSSWSWPVKLTPLLGFGEPGSAGVSRGMDYELPNRTRVHAAADGTVVYAGPGLGGYARLIIVDHGQALLSAYGFHGQTRVQEKQIVKVGGVLADTSGSSTDFSRFHFEVRKHGQPLDPRRLILRKR